MFWRQAQSRNTSARCGYTLLELVLASASAAVLMGGLASSLYIASLSLDVSTSGSLLEKRTTNTALATINGNLHTALSLSELTTTSVTMSVPDRDGDNVPETIRYVWSGTPGDPLTEAYNGGTATNLATNVQSFSLGWVTRLIDGVSSSPIVLFVSGQPADGDGGLGTPTAAEQLRIDLMNSWGYDVTVISQAATQAEIDAELANANVVYVSGEASDLTVGSKLNAATIGVVNENPAIAVNLGLVAGNFDAISGSSLVIENNSSYITAAFSLGELTILSGVFTLHVKDDDLAPDLVGLGSRTGLPTFTELAVMNQAGELWGSGAATARRVQLPWGDSSFDATALTADGQTLMQRAIEWAAGAGDDAESETTGLEYQDFSEAKLATNAPSLTVTLPPGTAEGDLLIAAVATDGPQQSSLGAPAGWNQISIVEYSASVTLGVWWKLAGAAESGSADFTWGGSEEAYGWIMRFTGHDPASPINATATAVGSSSTPATPAVTTTVDNALILHIGAFDDDDITVDSPGLTGLTAVTMDSSDSGLGTCSGGAAYVLQASAGNSSASNFSLTGSEQYSTVTIAIAPTP